jgi:hypothetical protein
MVVDNPGYGELEQAVINVGGAFFLTAILAPPEDFGKEYECSAMWHRNCLKVVGVGRFELSNEAKVWNLAIHRVVPTEEIGPTPNFEAVPRSHRMGAICDHEPSASIRDCLNRSTYHL